MWQGDSMRSNTQKKEERKERKEKGVDGNCFGQNCYHQMEIFEIL